MVNMSSGKYSKRYFELWMQVKGYYCVLSVTSVPEQLKHLLQ